MDVLGLGVLMLLGAVFFGLVLAVFAMVLWVVMLPFHLLAFVFRGLAGLLVLPFLALFGVIAVVLFGAGLLVFLVPAVPVLALVAAVIWLFRRSSRHAAPMSP